MMHKLWSIIMSVLIISIPINVSSAYAYVGSLTDLQYGGGKKVVPETGSLDVSVTAQIRDDLGASVPLNENNVRIYYNTFEYTFDTCTASGDSYQCSYSSEERDWEPGKYDLEVRLYDNYFLRMDKENGAFYVDAMAPVLSGVSFNSDVTGDFTIDYQVKDEACTGCTGYCAGLDRIEVEVAGTLIETITPGIDGCTFTSNITISPESNNLAEGSHKMCFTSYDKYGYSSRECRDLFIDYTPPLYYSDSFRIMSNGAQVLYSSPTAMNVEIYLNVSDEVSGVDRDGVTADFSALNNVNPDSYSSLSPERCDTSNITTCVWKMPLVGVDGSATVTIDILDKSGNANHMSKTINLPLDDTPPVATGFYPTGDKYLKSSGNEIVLEILDSQSGMGRKQAYLDLNRISGSNANAQADRCEDSAGAWLCYWENVNVAGRAQGTEMTVRINNIIDDALNGWDQTGSVSSETYTYDSVEPVFKSIAIRPLGVDIEVLREGDIVEIVAEIEEETSGLQPENVLAHINDLYAGDNYTAANSCVFDNVSIYTCKWEYSGPLDGDRDVRLNIIATDNAGNEKDSATDVVFGLIYIAKLEEKDVDFWQDSADTFGLGKLNRNFLWMSSSGTYVKINAKLVPKSGVSYVHGMEITSCDGLINKSGVNASETEPYTIKSQRYFPGIERNEKSLVVNIPNYEKAIVTGASGAVIYCKGEIIQGRSKRSDIYTPNEVFNFTATINFTNKIFELPDLNAIDKITTKEDEIEKLEDWIDNIETWTDFLEPICTGIQLVRQLLDGICIVWEGVSKFWSGTGDSSCFLKFELLQNLWMGKDGPQENSGIKFSQKSLYSVGFVCDLVLCEECSNMWNSVFGDQIKENWAQSLNDKWSGSGEYVPQLSYNPYNSLVVAVLCWPPCLTGILAKIKTYKAILETYNVCVNVATVRGENIHECDEFLKYQTCQQIVGEFWYLVDQFIKDFIINALLYVVEQKLAHLNECPAGASTSSASRTKCLLASGYRLFGWFVQFSNTMDKWDELKEHDFDKSAEDRAEKYKNQ